MYAYLDFMHKIDFTDEVHYPPTLMLIFRLSMMIYILFKNFVNDDERPVLVTGFFYG